MINALRYNEILEKAGFTKTQALGTIEVMSEILSQNLATRDSVKLSEFALRQDLYDRIDGVKEELNHKIDAVREELTHKIDAVREELNNKIDTVKAELDEKIDGVEIRLNQKIENLQKDMNLIKHEITLIHKHFETMEDKITIRLSAIMVVVMGLFKYLG